MESLLQVPTVGGIVLIDEKKPELAYRLLQERANGRRHVLCLTREPPERVARRYPMENAHHYWLITRGGELTVNPFRLDRVRELVEMFARSHPGCAFLLDGIELLMVMNSYEGVRDLLLGLREVLQRRHAELIIPIDTRTLTSRELAELGETFPLMRCAAAA